MRVVHAKTEQFDSTLASLLASQAAIGKDLQVFAHFHAEIDPETLQSWCSDCNRAFEMINQKLESTDAVCIAVQIARGEWKTHPMRTHALELNAIPTLFRFTSSTEYSKLVEAECFDQRLMEYFFK